MSKEKTNNNITLLYSSNLINCSELIIFDKAKINDYFEHTVSAIDKNILEDWTIRVEIIFGNNNKISVGKRGVTYPSDKEKWISIGIPIPCKDVIIWGLPQKCFDKSIPLSDKYYHFLEVNFNDFDNISNYVENSILKGLEVLFEIGISIKGHKIMPAKTQTSNKDVKQIKIRRNFAF